ncbi:replication-relaxation family protein [Paractinoplanes brasiliensis]|uniref:replication-relaxation family protein n=1 Tax=Paractinoplanes brasiliensis TaxID=52695 RepID=UPI0023B31615|nr:replication-relaxation family protein [Actinoplanes brasiliensis]
MLTDPGLTPVRESCLPSALTSVFSRTPGPTSPLFSQRRSHRLSASSACPPTDPAWSRVSPPGTTSPDDPGLVRAYQPRIRPDGYAEWVEHGVTVPVFLEYDTGGEQLPILVDKLYGYRDLFAKIGRVWPVLFSLHSATRERNLRRLFADEPPVVLVATCARDMLETGGLCPADAVWAAGHGDAGRLRLADLSTLTANLRHGSEGEAA